MDGVRSLFFWNNSSSKSKSFATYEYQIKAQAYETVSPGKEPVKGNNPVAGNGPVNLQRMLRSGAARGQSPVEMGRGHSADGPEAVRLREDMQLRPKSARPPSKGNSTPSSPSWSTPSFLRRMSRSNIESVTTKPPARPPPLPPSSPPAPARTLKSYEPTGANNSGVGTSKSKHGQNQPGILSPSEAPETYWSSAQPEQASKYGAPAAGLWSHQEEEAVDEDIAPDEDDGKVSKVSDRLNVFQPLSSRPLSRSRSLLGSASGDDSTSGWVSSLLSTSSTSAEPKRPVSAHASYPQPQPTANSEDGASFLENDDSAPTNQHKKESDSDGVNDPTAATEPPHPLRHRSGSIVKPTPVMKLQRRQHIGSMKKTSPRKGLPTPPSSPEKGQSSTSNADAAPELTSAATPPLSLKFDTASSKDSSEATDRRSSVGSPREKPAPDIGLGKSTYSLQSKYSTGSIRTRLFGNSLKKSNLAKEPANVTRIEEGSNSTDAADVDAGAAEVPSIKIEPDSTDIHAVQVERSSSELHGSHKIYVPPKHNILSHENSETDLSDLLSRIPPPMSGLTPNYMNLSNRNINIDDIELMSTDSDESDDDGNVTDDDYSSSEDSFLAALDVPTGNRNKTNNLTPPLSTNSLPRPKSSSGVPTTPPSESSRRKSASNFMQVSPRALSRPKSAMAHTFNHHLLSTEYSSRSFSNSNPPRMSYISDEDYSDLSDNPDPLLRRKRSRIVEEDLLFKSDGYGASGVLPGLHDMESVGTLRGLGLGFGSRFPFNSPKEDLPMPTREEKLTDEAPAPVIAMTRRPRSQHGSSWVNEAARGLGLMRLKDQSIAAEYDAKPELEPDNISVVDVPRAPRRASESKKSDNKKSENRRGSIRPESKASSGTNSKKEGKKPENIKNIESAVRNLGF
ncbi:hypothetical protein B7463_g2392, partial [Scytalidium lignicola]